VLRELCGHKPGELFGGAGTDIAEMIRYYAEGAAGLGGKLIARTKPLASMIEKPHERVAAESELSKA
jgi:hypothetical protein